MEYVCFGDIVFELLSYSRHNEEQNFPYARHETIKPPSSLQWMGKKELNKITLSVRWHMYFCNPQEEYEKLIEFANRGEYAPFIIAEKNLGNYVVESVESDFQQIDIQGNPTVIYANITLEEFVLKELQKKQIANSPQSQAKAKAVSKKPAQKPKYTVSQNRVVTKTNADGYTQSFIERK
jgi:phage protein U